MYVYALPASHDIYRLCMFKRYGPRSDCYLGSSLIRVHSVCFNDKIQSEVHLNMYGRHKINIRYFLGKSYWQDIG